MLDNNHAGDGSTSLPLAYARSGAHGDPSHWLWTTLFWILLAMLLVLLGGLGLAIVSSLIDWLPVPS